MRGDPAENIPASGSRASDAADGERADVVWQDETLARAYLTGQRRAIPGAAQQIDALLRIVAAAGLPVRAVLDLGCGDGILAAALLADVPDAEATLVDFSRPMLDAAAERFAGRTPAPRLVEADLTDPGWLDAVAGSPPFDVVVSGFAIHHLSDARKRRLYGEVFGLLRPGGVFVNVEHVASPTPWLERVFEELMIGALMDHERRVAGPRRREEVGRGYRERPDREANRLAPVEDQCLWLREIGFADVDCYHKLFELAVFGGRKPDKGRGAWAR